MTQARKVLDREKELKKTMRQLKIVEKDIVESFVRASGPGGQNVNKVSSCVMLKHVPTGIQVKVQASRSQGANRQKARLLLVKKIQQKNHEQKLKETQRKEKLKRQKRKRPKHLKEKILERKRQQSEKKKRRRKINPHKIEE